MRRKNGLQKGKPEIDKAKEMTPAEYFEYIKDKQNEITDKELLKVYENILRMMERYTVTGQKKPLEKLQYLARVMEKEIPVVQAGYNKFVYRWDVEEYIESVKDECVFIIEMENYEREFPDEVIDKIIEAKEVFGDNLFVIYTDYTQKTAKKVAKERREKDPILFGAIMDGDVCFDRLYFICDWTDEFCDLTLDQLAEKWDKIHEKENRKFVHPVEDGRSFEQLKEAMKHYVKSDKKEDGFISTYSPDNQIINRR